MNGMSGYGYSNGGWGWTSSSGSFTGHSYSSNPYSSFGYRSNYNGWR